MPEGRPPPRHPGPEDADHPEGERLQKVLARVGLGSRRACEELIGEGRVTVNGARAALGRRVDVGRDVVALDGVPLPVLPGLVHYLLHKPAGVVTTAHDPSGRPTVLELVPDTPRVFPVGRLDADSEGLLVLTNDGDLAQRLTHPSFGVEKEYLVETEGALSAGALRRLRRGIELDDGITAPATVGVVAPGVIRIVIHEGRNRQIRRMCDAVGHPVGRLVRTRIGPISDPRLRAGQWRALRGPEVRALARAATRRDGPGQRRAPPGGRTRAG
jgi:23S rRNA pseudouridine2605 synthase